VHYQHSEEVEEQPIHSDEVEILEEEEEELSALELVATYLRLQGQDKFILRTKSSASEGRRDI